ncbi:conserved exported protein of unknown function [Paraburkholderia dioscoreae]|uniref:Lipoprotein n=2 Tax=Burkholderiaceae TaxID=119060 RepID=A0A5Q4ZJY1_9BURK|nr:conserved exported protein of unknown function [Paraburkholderia dioscoreae]
MRPGLRTMLALSTLAFAAACSKSGPPTIIGHWRAERVQVFSAQLPVGPEIVVSEKEISSPGTDVDMSVHGFEAKSGQVTIDLAYGVGLTFYFDGPDRVFLKVPLVGKVYYRRVVDNAALASAASSVPIVAQPQSVSQAAPVAGAQSGGNHSGPTAVGEQTALATQSVRGGSQPASEPAEADGQSAAEYQLASAAAKQGQSDAAIDHLNSAFKAGFRDVARLDSSPEFGSLANDVRYQALVARYR